VGRKLIDVPGYTFRLFVTSCTDGPAEIWRDYNRRADMENRIAELKHDLGAHGFCLKQFFATEAAFRAVLLLFNLLSEFQRDSRPDRLSRNGHDSHADSHMRRNSRSRRPSRGCPSV
jgi:DNA-directed RNA polymerase subunit N (RpoN/RPB10)